MHKKHKEEKHKGKKHHHEGHSMESKHGPVALKEKMAHKKGK